MNNLLNIKWKVAKPKLPYDKYVIVPIDWHCSCDKKDESYIKHGCLCQVGYMAGLSFGWEKREVAKHIVELHNKYLEEK